MTAVTEDMVLLAVAEPLAYANSICHRVAKMVGPSRWLRIPATWRVSLGAVYVHLGRLEKAGFIWSELSAEIYPERGNRPRRYYHLTAAGAFRAAQIRARSEPRENAATPRISAACPVVGTIAAFAIELLLSGYHP
jgi:Transcriptional regulator PadR-like family